MNFDYWFPWYPARFKADTMHLTALQDGIYRRLIDHYMETKLGLPDNNSALARIAGVDVDKFVDNFEPIRELFTLDKKTGRFLHKRCEAILRDQNARSSQASEKAKKAAKMRWKKEKQKQGVKCSKHTASNAQAMLNDATGQDRTGQDNVKLESGSNNKNLDKQSKTPPTPPRGKGVLNGGGLVFKVEHKLDDKAINRAKAKAPGWDVYHLMRVYDEGIASGKRNPPENPNAAFPAWCARYTKGKKP